MLYLWLLLAFGAGAAAFAAFDDSDDDADDDTGDETPDPEDPPEPPDPTEIDTTVFVQSGETYLGTPEADIYLTDPSATDLGNVTIDSGAGDDLFLFDSNAFGGLFNSEIETGTGNDAIGISGDGIALSTGDGDDTILGSLISSTLSGGAGDDDITLASSDGDITFADGGAGDDVINAHGSNNIVITGGEGDDTIQTDGQIFTGTGFVIAPDGGAGDDLLQHQATLFQPETTLSVGLGAASLTGGEGSDTFEISFGLPPVLSESPGLPPVVDLPAAAITDFEQSTDTIIVDLDASTGVFTATEARLTEDTAAGVTTLEILFESTTFTNQNAQITIAATGLTFDDIAFVGGSPTLL